MLDSIHRTLNYAEFTEWKTDSFTTPSHHGWIRPVPLLFLVLTEIFVLKLKQKTAIAIFKDWAIKVKKKDWAIDILIESNFFRHFDQGRLYRRDATTHKISSTKTWLFVYAHGIRNKTFYFAKEPINLWSLKSHFYLLLQIFV